MALNLPCTPTFPQEDLALLAAYGSREAFFPQQRWAPLCHVLFGLLFLGLAPLGVQLISERLLFLDPELVDLRRGVPKNNRDKGVVVLSWDSPLWY